MFSALALLLLLAAPQPIPYSHKTHLALGLQCKNCHTNPDPGEMMGLPATKACMGCHATVKTESPAIQKLAQFAKDQKPVPWLRIYQIPGYVYFSHRAHQEAGANCRTCHGPVAQRDVMTKEVEVSMGACMDCHRKNKASIDCAYCHEQKQ
jgi:hypothetical protein